MTDVVLDHVTVRRGDATVVDDVSLVAPTGSLTVIVGASGAGKTSVLRAVAGLDRVAAGTIRLDGADVNHLSARDRDTSIATYGSALLPTRNVARNIALPLEVRRETADRIADRVGVEARVLAIDHLLRREPGQLSAGEAQMAQIARSLVHLPRVLLLDEPFAAIGGERSAILRREIRHLQQQFGVTTFVATNDPADVADVADQVVVLERGGVVQVGPFDEVFERPATVASAVLTGDATIERVTVEGDGSGAWLVHPSFRVRAWAPSVRRHVGRELLMITRPEWWQVVAAGGHLEGTVVRQLRAGGTATATVEAAGRPVEVRNAPVETGQHVRLKLTAWTLIDPLDGFTIR